VEANRVNIRGSRQHRRRKREPGEPNEWWAALRRFVALDCAKRGWLRNLNENAILAWADACHSRTGKWPVADSGAIPEAPGESWMAIEAALSLGMRGLPGGKTLARLLAEERGKRHLGLLPLLSVSTILEWADAHFDRTGRWPSRDHGRIPEADATDETWCHIDNALRIGMRGLEGGSSLARLLAEHRARRNRMELPAFSIDQILVWADLHQARTGSWPALNSGPIADAPEETWLTVDGALRQGHRGLLGGSSLARLLAKYRGRRNRSQVPTLSIEQILQWADECYARQGRWPTLNTGQIDDAPGETWTAIDLALCHGTRGLPGGSSLARLLAEQRGKRNTQALPALEIERILEWADAYHVRHGRWPTAQAGPIDDAPEESWSAVHTALDRGLRGLSGGSSLARLLAEHRGKRNIQALPALQIERILEWADAHHARHGHWPTNRSGAIGEAPGETWANVDQALRIGIRGLVSGSSLPRLLAERRGKRNARALPALEFERILQWADAYHRRLGRWPTSAAGPIDGAVGESWSAVDTALDHGARGLPGGSSLARLLAERRGNRNRKALPPYNFAQILAWADAYHSRHGRWPTRTAGAIAEAAGETWAGVSAALTQGRRGLPGGSSLSKLLDEHGRKLARPRKPR
jgi:hypothetical protein